MKKTNKSENWFIPLVFASIGQKYLFNLFDFNYNVFKDSFDIAKMIIDLGVYTALFACAYFAIGYFKK